MRRFLVLQLFTMAAAACGGGGRTGADAANVAEECRGPGRYEAGKGGDYRPCCPGLTEVPYPAPAFAGANTPICDRPPLRVYACVKGTCGDGICEPGEAPACGCVADCPQAAWGVADAGAGVTTVDTGAVADARAGADALACRWPSTFDHPPGAPGTCRATRYFLTCPSATVTEDCPSDDPSRCRDTPGVVVGGVSFADCRDLCDPNEYAVTCGGVGPHPDPPAGCRALPPNPGGGTAACCPCE